jgi:hypothetical protein
MRAIDFSMDTVREPDPKGERVNLVLSGKFLAYKQYGLHGACSMWLAWQHWSPSAGWAVIQTRTRLLEPAGKKIRFLWLPF